MDKYIPWMISVIAILVSLYALFHKENKDDTQKQADRNTSIDIAIARLEAKLDMLLGIKAEIKDNVALLDSKVDEHEIRITKLEAQIEGKKNEN